MSSSVLFKYLRHWTILLPVVAAVYYFMGFASMGGLYQLIGGGLLIASVLSAVHHSEVVAHKVGEPFGTIILAIAITIIEVSLIVSLMLSGGEDSVMLARDTVFAAVMIILNGIVGICLLVGSARHFEQFFHKSSANTALVSLVAILFLTLILPNFTTSMSGPIYSEVQLIFVSLACLIIYSTFLLVQTIRHRNYFLYDEDNDEDPDTHYEIPMPKVILSLLFLVMCLALVVLLAKKLSPAIEDMVISANMPMSMVGVIIAIIVLMPEGLAAIRAARNNRIQTSLNLALGSALASIGLTIPAVSIVASILDIDLVLGIDPKSLVLLMLSILIVMMSLSKGKTNILYGVVLLVNFAAYIFTIIFP